MALTEIQLPTKEAFYGSIQNKANSLNNIYKQLEDLQEFIGNVTSEDLDAMAVPTGQIRTDLTDFRTAINEAIDFYKGTATTQTKVLGDVIDKLRSI